MATSSALSQAHERVLPLTHGQEQLWFLDRLNPGQPVYNVPFALRIRGPLDTARLRAAADRVVAQHEALRACFPEANGIPLQVIAGPGPAGWLEENADEASLTQILAAEAARPFVLSAGPPHRFRLLRLDEEDHVLSAVFHHIAVDGPSLGLVISGLLDGYREGGAATAGPAPSWGDWARRRREEVDRPAELAEGLRYWEGRLRGLPVPELPADRLRGASTSTSGGHVRQTLPAELTGRLRSFARARGVSLFVVLAAAVNVLISRYTGEDDIPLGVPLSERLDPSAEGVVGHFVNMAVLRTDMADDPPFGDLLDRILDQTFDMHEYGWVPFEKVVAALRPSRAAGRNPLFQVSVQLVADPTAAAGAGLPGAEIEVVTAPVAHARFDLAVNFFDAGERITLDLEYAADVFGPWRMEGFARHLMTVLAEASANPGLTRSSIPLMLPAETGLMLAAGTGPELDLPGEPLHVRIARVAARRAGATAVTCRGERLSYAELDRRASRLARRLRSAGLRAGDVVAVLLEKDLDAVVALIGVLKAGGAFTVLDPGHPPARLRLILADAGARLVVTRGPLLGRLPAGADAQPVLVEDPGPAGGPTAGDGAWQEWATPESPAYVLYTSGSTGVPKGVVIQHSALTCFTEGYRHVFPFTQEDRLLQFSALTFDMAHGEIFTALTLGATLVLVPADTARSPAQLAALMRDEAVTYAGLMPALLALLEPEPYPRLRYLMAGGDVLAAELVDRWNLPGRLMVNMYGPTEAAVACSHHVCGPPPARRIPPIGRPQHNRLLYVVDRWGNLVPRGVPGELLVGGHAGLARGYLGAPELTTARFAADSWGRGERVYRTGDTVSWNAGYELEFHGRLDHQVKLNGLRIELGEIESALLQHPGVENAAVVAHTSGDGAKHLVGYVASARPEAIGITGLRQTLAGAVPAYMIPANWVVLPALPLTSSGKVDRRALPPPPEAHPRPAAGGPCWPDELHGQIAGIFTEVLERAAIGPDDDFFDLGGTSFQAMRVLGRIRKQLGVELSVRALYTAATVTAVAAETARLRGQAHGGTDSDG